jgi:dihydroneopterin aldolase / 2-amino-4-hydroxy-6-hydroxymethyldihydropteridine diphosphokinase
MSPHQRRTLHEKHRESMYERRQNGLRSKVSISTKGGPVNDAIELCGLQLLTTVGVLPHEREAPQPLLVDLRLFVDLNAAGQSDALGDTINYGEVCDTIARVADEVDDLLLERLAERLTAALLCDPLLERVELSVKKLRPPVPHLLETSGVRITRARGRLTPPESHLAYLSIGSNLGDRCGFLRHAVDFLRPSAVSQVYETAPVGGPEQGPFLNMVLAVETQLDPYALLRRCQRVERAANRKRMVHWGPRTLDVDIIFYDDFHIVSPELTLPHPRTFERRFVLAPLAELAPERLPTDWEITAPDDHVQLLGALHDLA